MLYTGVTSDIVFRVIEHREHHFPTSFTSRYNCNKLVYYKFFETIEEAIEQEKYIKGKSRAFKIARIEETNPEWSDLWVEIKSW